MYVGILGALKVTADGEAVEVGGARLRVLLIRLALGVGRVVTVEELSDALWPEDKPADRANAMQSLVSRLRRALPDASVLSSVPGGYRLDLPPDAVDAHRFERLAREGRRALTGGDPASASRLLGEALGLWRGPALADAAEVPFATAYAAGLDEARLAAAEDRAEAELASGRPAHLVAELSVLAVLHPLRERLHGLLVRALYAAGGQAEALVAYEDFRRRLADELGADPGPELRKIHLEVLRADRAPQAVGPHAAHRSRGNLRAPLTSFVGRDREIRRIGEQLKEGRLVTLVGPGGAGKTRLATTVGADLPGGAWLVELAPVTDPADVPQAVLGTLGHPGILEMPGAPRDTMSRIVEVLSAGDATLVLDNCEHLIDAVARLADELLGRCPRLRVLATSREPLGILGEALCPVPPLELPQPGAAPELSPAVRLFIDRAAAVRPDFVLTDEVVEICRRLDGLPLAIELATARLRSLTIEQVAARLDDRFRLLTGGSRTALPRHRTLRAVVDWSWDLLDDAERRLTEQLAVFPAGATPEAAERLGGSMDLLAALVDKSLIQLVEGPRYRMLETIREFGLERLAESGRIADVRAAHAAYFLELAETAEPYLRGSEQLIWMRRLEADGDNLLAALRFAADTGDAATAVRLAAALTQFWGIRGKEAEAAGWQRLALDVPGESPEPARTIVAGMCLINTFTVGGYEKLANTVDVLQGLAPDEVSDESHPLVVLIDPFLTLLTDDTTRGTAIIERRLSHPNPWIRAALRMLRGFLRENDGDMAGMRRDAADAADGFREVGDRWGLAHALTSLSNGHVLFGDFDGAISALEEAIRLIQELNPDDNAGHQRIWLATVRVNKGDVDRARAEMQEIAESDAQGWPAREVSFARLGLGDLARHEGDLDEAARQYGMATTALANAPVIAPQFRALILSSEANLAADLGDLETAERRIDEAIGLALEVKDMPVLARVGVTAAMLRACRGDAAQAAKTLGATEQLRGASDRFNPDIVRLVERLRGELGDASYEAAYTGGRDLDRAGALACVRSTPARTGDPAGDRVEGRARDRGTRPGE
ncbi:BTAD domain-containing putative transcriptional regulator [Streptosporangium sp. 'caverna']|uniref:BTAD domain-containing putative transcriptional regulator n=1 Tax=Streptosporangium sp. 'caverna' TaxID=2202249 RepID=UPI000D7DF001|nr:BTAD domain-containing putative transcriptional regulator [Streptosporangium sp. 'caverna']AWS47453.1 AfsR/SARP family transcriptional regulator [Streptosporangium sp. 'caverna']